jgi:tetratricopeptide (TPR) repeat protein
MHEGDQQVDAEAEREAIKQLVALGYVDAPDENTQKAVEQCIREQQHNLARSLIQSGEYAQAADILRKLRDERPQVGRYVIALAKCLYMLGDVSACRELAEPLLDKLDENSPMANLLLGTIALAEGRSDEALRRLLEGEKIEARLPGLHQLIGQTYLMLRRAEDAERAFRLAIDVDGDSAVAYDGLAAALIRLRRYEDAVDAALTAVGLMHNLTAAHFHLGVALARCGRIEQAVLAFEMCLTVQPDSINTHAWLQGLYEKALHDDEKARYHRQKIKDLMRDKQMKKASPKALRTP